MKINNRKLQKKTKVRSIIRKSGKNLRLSIFRSNRYLYAQIIDDKQGRTLVTISTKKTSDKKSHTKTEEAKKTGLEFAKKLLFAKIKKVVFDRGCHKYEGRVKAFADGVREGGVII